MGNCLPFLFMKTIAIVLISVWVGSVSTGLYLSAKIKTIEKKHREEIMQLEEKINGLQVSVNEQKGVSLMWETASKTNEATARGALETAKECVKELKRFMPLKDSEAVGILGWGTEVKK